MSLWMILIAALAFVPLFPRWASAGEIAHNVSIVVRVPASTPEGERVFITGNHPSLGNWKANAVALEKVAANTYIFRTFISSETVLEFKFTRGDFSKVEKTPEGFEMQNRVLAVNPQTFGKITCEVSAWADGHFASAETDFSRASHRVLNIIGNYELIKDFESKHLGHPRNVVVYLPESYHTSPKRYPVLYMHDGNNLFDPYISHLDCDWGLDETIHKLTATHQMREIIVVGIYNTPDRAYEYTPFRSNEYGGGGGDNYARFMTDELKPFIDGRFRTLKDAANTAVGGASFGGIFSLYVGVMRPDVFSAIMAISPSLWWADERLTDWVVSQKPDPRRTRIWMDMGLIEGDESVRCSRAFDKAFREAFPAYGTFYRYEEFANAPHNAVAWGKRFHLPLSYIFGTEHI